MMSDELITLNPTSKEWETATKLLNDSQNKVSRKKIPNLKHSFMKTDKGIICLTKDKLFTREDRNIKICVKKAITKEGDLVALKIISIDKMDLISNPITEGEIIADIGIGSRSITLDSSKKIYLPYKFLGTSIDQLYGHSDRGVSDFRIKCWIAAEILYKLHLLHLGKASKEGKKYIHGDVHFGNIVINESYVPNFIDFGRATSKFTLEDIKSDWLQLIKVFIKKNAWVEKSYFLNEFDASKLYFALLGEINSGIKQISFVLNKSELQLEYKFVDRLLDYDEEGKLIIIETDLCELKKIDLSELNLTPSQFERIVANIGDFKKHSDWFKSLNDKDKLDISQAVRLSVLAEQGISKADLETLNYLETLLSCLTALESCEVQKFMESFLFVAAGLSEYYSAFIDVSLDDTVRETLIDILLKLNSKINVLFEGLSDRPIKEFFFRELLEQVGVEESCINEIVEKSVMSSHKLSRQSLLSTLEQKTKLKEIINFQQLFKSVKDEKINIEVNTCPINFEKKLNKKLYFFDAASTLEEKLINEYRHKHKLENSIKSDEAIESEKPDQSMRQGKYCASNAPSKSPR